MGARHTKHQRLIPRDEAVKGLKQKVMLLQEEVNEIMCMRDAEIQAYEREMMVFAIKEAEWRKQRRKLREEVKKLRRKGEGGPGQNNADKGGSKEWLLLGEEQARKDDAVEKWKQLYFAIKIELDDLIQRTNQGAGLCWKVEAEEMVEELQKELMAKEETIELQQSQIASMKQEEYKRKREIDILKQSLKIVCHNKGNKNV